MSARDDGFTLVELLVVMMLATIVLFATLGAFDAFSRTTAANDRLTRAQDSSRRELDGAARLLRNATAGTSGRDAILWPTGSGATNDLVFTTYDWPFPGGTAGQLHAIRYCLDSSRTLWREGLDDAAGYASTQLPCPSSWTHATVADAANGAGNPVFTLDATRRAVAITLTLDGTRGAATPLTLRSGVFLRTTTTRSTLTAGDISASCSTTSRTATLTPPATFDATLSISYANAAGQVVGSGPSVTVPASASSTLTVTVANRLGPTQATFTKVVPAC